MKPTNNFPASPLYPGSLRRLIDCAVSSLAPVFISGEKGMKKKALARAMHRQGLQAGMPFITVNAGRFEEEMTNLLHSGQDLRGTLHLSGAESLSPAMQGVLDDYLSSGELSLGGMSRTALMRIILTSEYGPSKLTAESLLEQTLLQRLSIIHLDLPALRSRKEEIPSIAEYLRDQLCQGYRLARKEISSEALRCLSLYDWPHNIDELEGVLGKALVVADEIIMPRNLTISQKHEPQASNSRTPEPLNSQLPASSSQSLALRLAHDIKNPLVSIKTYANLLEDKFGDEEFRREFYQVMKRDVEKIDRVVEEILSSASTHIPDVAAGHADVEEGPSGKAVSAGDVDINMLTDRLLGELREELARRKIAVFKYLSDEVSGMPMENGQFRTALGGILLSVLENTPDGGDIYIRTARRASSGGHGDGRHLLEIAIEGSPLEGGLEKLRSDVAWQERIMKSRGADLHLKESASGGVSATITLQLQETV